jgi:hypothetical protein
MLLPIFGDALLENPGFFFCAAPHKLMLAKKTEKAKMIFIKKNTLTDGTYFLKHFSALEISLIMPFSFLCAL